MNVGKIAQKSSGETSGELNCNGIGTVQEKVKGIIMASYVLSN